MLKIRESDYNKFVKTLKSNNLNNALKNNFEKNAIDLFDKLEERIDKLEKENKKLQKKIKELNSK